MTTNQPTTSNQQANAKASTAAIPMPTRHVHRERDFGVGYGNSSGYASSRRYASRNWAAPHFKFA